MAERFDNRVNHHGPDNDQPIVRKVPADSVPFGDSISANGETVWAAYDAQGTLIAVTATADEARRKYRERQRSKGGKS